MTPPAQPRHRRHHHHPVVRLATGLAAVGLFPLAAAAAAVVPPATLGSWACTGVCGTSPASGDIALSPLNNPQYGYVSTAGSGAYGASPLQLSSNSRGSGIEANGSRFLSGSFQAAAADSLSVHFQYVSTDGKNYDDYAWARIVTAADNRLVAWLFVAQSNNSSTGQIVPGDVVDKKDFDPDNTIVDFDNFAFNSKTSTDPVDWAPLGGSNGSCWEDNAAGCGHTGWLEARHAFAAGGLYRLEVGVVNWGDEAFDSGLAFDFQGLQAISAVPEPGGWLLGLAGLGVLGAATRRPRR